jgi:hypothetical protein
MEQDKTEELIKKLVNMLESKIERLNKLKLRLQELLSGEYGIDTILEEIDWTTQDICDEFLNCRTCPIKNVCDLALSFECKGIFSCEECPKLHKCLEWGILEIDVAPDRGEQ